MEPSKTLLDKEFGELSTIDKPGIGDATRGTVGMTGDGKVD